MDKWKARCESSALFSLVGFGELIGRATLAVAREKRLILNQTDQFLYLLDGRVWDPPLRQTSKFLVGAGPRPARQLFAKSQFIKPFVPKHPQACGQKSSPARKSPGCFAY